MSPSCCIRGSECVGADSGQHGYFDYALHDGRIYGSSRRRHDGALPACCAAERIQPITQSERRSQDISRSECITRKFSRIQNIMMDQRTPVGAIDLTPLGRVMSGRFTEKLFQARCSLWSENDSKHDDASVSYRPRTNHSAADRTRRKERACHQNLPAAQPA